MLRPFALLLALVLALSFVAPVAAVPPDVSTEHFDYTYAVADCGDFTVMDHIVYDLDSTTFYDQNGAAIKVHFRAQGVDNIYNPAHPDYVIPGKFSWNAAWDVVPDTLAVAGLYIHITLPGRGSVFFDAGKATFVFLDNGDALYVPLAGHHELDAEFCALLSAQKP